MPVQKKTDETPSAKPDENAGSEVQTGREVAPTETVTQDLPETVEEKNTEPQSYVHLANGTVLKVNDKDLPTPAGAGAPNGFWQTGNKVHHVIGIYPVETTVGE